jgi:predicted nuclease of predicted toxin-antitoxin system
MRLLLDQGLPRSAADGLRQAGHEAAHAGDIGLGTAPDSDIIKLARRDGFVIVTLDADFHTQIALEGAASPSVIRIRQEGLRAEPLVALLTGILDSCADDLARGALVSATSDEARIRLLPIGE